MFSFFRKKPEPARDLLPGARALRTTLDRTSLWQREHIEFFNSVKTEDEGEWYCLHLLMPSNLQYHRKIVDWQERDLTTEERKMLDETCNIFSDAKASEKDAK